MHLVQEFNVGTVVLLYKDIVITMQTTCETCTDLVKNKLNEQVNFFPVTASRLSPIPVFISWWGLQESCH